MKTFALSGSTRTIAERSSEQSRAIKALRKNNQIPCVLYGGETVTHFSVSVDSVRNLIYTPEIFAVELTIDGKTVMALVKDIQFQAVTDAVIHMDFLEVNETTPVVFEVPVVLQGHAEGVKAGGKLTLRMRKLKVKAAYTQIPEKLYINVESLGLGKTIQVAALNFEGLELMNAKDSVVCAVQLTRAARGAMAAAKG